MESMNTHTKFIADYKLFESQLNGESKTSLHTLRSEAAEQFAALGFPTMRNEEWKYTNVLSLLQREYTVLHGKSATSLTHEDIASLLIDGLDAFVIVLVNGVVQKHLSSMPAEQNGVVVGSLAEAYRSHSAVLNAHFAQYANYRTQAFTALNTAFASDGVFVYAPDGTTIEKPIHIVSVADTRNGDVLVQPRVLVVLGKSSAATVVESYGVLGAHMGLSNSIAEVVLGNSARAEYYKLQDTPSSASISTLQVQQERDSVLRTATITLDGEFVRNDLNIVLNGEGCEAHLNGLYLPTGTQHVDNHTLVDHAKPHCNSNELYKGILSGASTGVFNGKVMVRPDAQKTNAFQSNRNILLSETASINAKPQLEIFADDVKCSHGATIGRLDETALFYLRSRGLGEEYAKALLLGAFAADVLETIHLAPVQKHIEQRVAERLHLQ